MSSMKRIGAVIVVLGLLALVLPLAVLAQSPSQILINYPEISEGIDAVSMSFYFSVLDASGQVIPEPQIESVTVELGDGNRYAAAFEQPTSDAYIVLVLDASGSMGGAMPQMRQAAIQAVENAPEEAVFAVIQFSDTINLIQDFSDDRRQVAEKIDTIRSIAGGGTCLYDAAYRAIEILNAAPLGRRGVILFTDGNDMTAAGTPCSQHTYEEVISLATQRTSRVPIHTIGLSTEGEGAINEAELREMASTTGGFSEVGEINSLALLFQRIITGLSNQWVARTDVYPAAGENTARLIVHMADGTEIESAPVNFVASRAYVAPPSATVSSISYTSKGNVVFNLVMTNAERVTNFELQVLDVRNNIPAPPFTTEATENLEVAAANFESGNEYQVTIIGRSEAGEELFSTTYVFRYNPEIAEGELKITSVQLDREVPEFVVEVRATNIEGIANYQVWLNNQATNTVVPGSRATVPSSSVITIPLADIPNGTYTVVVTAVSDDGTVLGEATYEEAVYKLGLFSRLGRGVRASLVLLGIFGAVAVVAAGLLVKFLVLDPRKERAPSILVENTMLRRGSGLDDWGRDAMQLDKRRQREQSARQRGGAGGVEPAPPRMRREARPAPPPASVLPTAPPAATAPAPPGAVPGVQIPHARLIVELSPEGAYDGTEYLITTVPYTIGRKGNNLNIEISSVSRTHATIFYRQGQFTIRDANSTNGTTVDEVPVSSSQDTPLRPGAVIGLGKTVRLRFSS